MDEYNEIFEHLSLNQAIKCQLDKIISQANKTVTLLKPINDKDSGMEENQIRNVLDVASESLHVEVVTNFIRYQIGRSGIGEKWQYGDFGEKVIKDIESGIVKECAKSAVYKTTEEIMKSIGSVDQEHLNSIAYVRLTALYLGYLNRAFYYCKKGNGWGKLAGKEDNNVS
ncbi:MAG: hypothetical protein QG641_2127 [Candidatus Poribacteria bacterium]|nr:hypothetical protein [Candidatus Poribacteria bacterium]